MDTFFWYWQLAALCDLDRFRGLVSLSLGDVFDLLDDFVAFHDFAEHYVLAVEMTEMLADGEELEEGTYPGVEVVMKNWEPLVSFPALAMERRPFLECFNLKFSSANLAP